ncbi:MAG: hypothetical protein RJA49_428 [Actinomycetota bacterium]
MTSRLAPSRTLLAFGLTAALAIGLTACGGSDGGLAQLTSTTVGAPGDTASPGDTAGGGDVTVPSVPGLSADCQQLYSQFVQAMGGVGAGQATDASKLFDNLKKVLPAELQSAAQTLSEAYGGLTALIAQYNGDYAKAAADPAFQAAIQSMSKPEVAAASKAISDYFTSQCPQG